MMLFCRRDVLDTLGKDKAIRLLFYASVAVPQTKVKKLLTIDMPTKRRGNTETRYYNHYDIDVLIEYIEEHKPNHVVMAEDLHRVRNYLRNKQ